MEHTQFRKMSYYETVKALFSGFDVLNDLVWPMMGPLIILVGATSFHDVMADALVGEEQQKEIVADFISRYSLWIGAMVSTGVFIKIVMDIFKKIKNWNKDSK